MDKESDRLLDVKYRLETVKYLIDSVIAQCECCGFDDLEAQSLLQGALDRLNNVRI